MKNNIYVALIIAMLCPFARVDLSCAETPTVHKSVLDNGTVVLCRYMPDSPISVVQVRALSGLSNEGEFAGSGISHLLEHLLFKGTREKRSEELFDDIRRIGGLINGFTGLDSAAYHITVPNDNLKDAVAILTDMVMDPVFSDDEFTKEKEVIEREINMHNDNPGTKRMRQLFENAFKDNVYKYPVIGYVDRFKSISMEEVLRYHEQAYSPDRIVIGVAGGVKPDEVMDIVGGSFSGYKRKGAWTPVVREEPRQLSPREAVMEDDVSLGYISIGFRSTDLFSEDVYAMDVLSGLLGNGRDSRLYQSLVVDDELLYSISASNMTPRYPGLFIISGQGEPGELYKAKEEILSVIERLKAGDIEEDELERVKNIVMAGFLRNQETVYDMVSSMTLSQALIGDPGFYGKYVEKISSVTVDDVKKAAIKYLRPSISTTSIVVPKGFYLKAEDNNNRYDVDAEDAEMKTLANGLRVIVMPRNRLPLVSCNMIFPGGVSSETDSNMGISSLMASLMVKGTKNRKEKDIVPVFEGMGASIGASSGKDSIKVSMGILSKDIAKTMEIFEDVVKNPVFPPEEIEKRKKKVKAVIKEQQKGIGHKADISLRRILYGDHPYAFNMIGEEGTINSITRSDLVRFHDKYISPGNAVLVFVGDINPEKAYALAREHFGSWKGPGVELQEKPVKRPEGVTIREIEMEKEQSYVLVGFPGVSYEDESKYTLSVISSMLSSGGGILFEAIRQDQGLAYSCGARSYVSYQPGYYVFIVKTSRENIPKVREIVEQVINRVKNGDFTEDDLESTKNKMMTGYATSIEKNSSLADIMARSELLGLGYMNYKRYPEKVKSVTKDDIMRCANEIFSQDSRAEVIVYSKDNAS